MGYWRHDQAGLVEGVRRGDRSVGEGFPVGFAVQDEQSGEDDGVHSGLTLRGDFDSSAPRRNPGVEDREDPVFCLGSRMGAPPSPIGLLPFDPTVVLASDATEVLSRSEFAHFHESSQRERLALFEGLDDCFWSSYGIASPFDDADFIHRWWCVGIHRLGPVEIATVRVDCCFRAIVAAHASVEKEAGANVVDEVS